jgi:uncharacterized membrane protein YkvA (DUF1232 family)
MQWLQRLKQKAKQLKREAQVLVVAYRDQRTPVIARLLIAITLGYLLSPIDLIPDFIPVLGLLDDLIIVPILITLSLRIVPPVVLADARATVQANPAVLKKGNWIAAMLIITIWLLLLYFTYRHFAH